MLLKALVPPRLSISEVNVLLSTKVPRLLSVPPANCSDPLLTPVLPLHVVVPFSSIVRPPEISLAPAPLAASALLYAVVPVPVCVAASQIEGAETVTVPLPPSVPPLCVNDAIVDVSFSVRVPAEMLVLAAALNELPQVRLPPVTASMLAPSISRLLTLSAPERCVTV